MKFTVFTLCSNNYLAHAKTLGDSVLFANPKVTFIIGLVDKWDPAIDRKLFSSFEVIPFDTLGFDQFSGMLAAYNIIEFNTAVKPFYFEHLFKRYGSTAQILYLDPDIVVFTSLEKLFDKLGQADVLLTPNITRITVEANPGELASLRHGKFNLGFIGLRYSETTISFLDWWKSRLTTHCLIQKGQGLFVDQKWIDLAPLFFDSIQLVREPGYNMAWWNLHERKLLIGHDGYSVNEVDEPLYFFHFSGYRPGSFFITGRNNDSSEYAFDHYPELRALFEDYSRKLDANGYQNISSLQPSLRFRKEQPVVRGRIKRLLKRILN